MTIESLPPISRWRAPYADVYSSLWKLRGLNADGQVFIGTARGAKMRTRAGVFDILGSVLQFPPYFGDNWNAFNDSFSDLDWLRASTILVVLLNAENVLKDGDPGEIGDFLEYVNESITRIVPVHLRLVLHTELAGAEANDPYAAFPFIDLGERLTGS